MCGEDPAALEIPNPLDLVGFCSVSERKLSRSSRRRRFTASRATRSCWIAARFDAALLDQIVSRALRGSTTRGTDSLPPSRVPGPPSSATSSTPKPCPRGSCQGGCSGDRAVPVAAQLRARAGDPAATRTRCDSRSAIASRNGSPVSSRTRRCSTTAQLIGSPFSSVASLVPHCGRVPPGSGETLQLPRGRRDGGGSADIAPGGPPDGRIVSPCSTSQ